MSAPSYPWADWVEAAAAVGTFGVAIFVLLTARAIQKAEGVFRQNQLWNEFGHAVARYQKSSRIGDFLVGKDVFCGLERGAIAKQLTSREAFLLMSFFNVVSNEYNAYKAGTIDEDYFVHSLGMTCRVLQGNVDWIIGFLEDHGYEAGYVSFLQRVAQTQDCKARIELARAERPTRMLLGRKWRSRSGAASPHAFREPPANGDGVSAAAQI